MSSNSLLSDLVRNISATDKECARLELPARTDGEKAQRLIEKAEKACLVGNSLRFKPVVHCEVIVEPALQLTT